MASQTKQIKTRLHIIGCGTPTPTPERFGSCLILEAGDQRLMFDCGPGSTYKMARMGIAPTSVGHLFFTHHHYDHNADYPCFLLCRWDHERSGVERLKVYGAPPTAVLTDRLIGEKGAFVDDWRARVSHPASQEVYAARGGKVPRPAPRFDVREIKAGERIETGPAVVTIGKALHLQPMMECLCFRIDWEGGAIVITGDTGRHRGIEKLAEGAGTLVVNVWDHQENMSPAMLSGFCGTLDAAEMARAAGVDTLIVTHQGPNLSRPGSREKAIADMAGVFRGRIVFGEEFMELEMDEIG